MNLLSMIMLTLAAVAAVLLNYVYWVFIKTQGRRSPAERAGIKHGVRTAYLLNGTMLLFITIMLLYFLFTHVLFAFPQTFAKSFLVVFSLAALLEVVNYLSYYYLSKSL